MSEMTYHRDSEQPVKAKVGKCDDCGRRLPIVGQIRDVKLCRGCFDRAEQQWNRCCGGNRVRPMPMPEEPFILEDEE